jgi:hypothetical protein
MDSVLLVSWAFLYSVCIDMLSRYVFPCTCFMFCNPICCYCLITFVLDRYSCERLVRLLAFNLSSGGEPFEVNLRATGAHIPHTLVGDSKSALTNQELVDLVNTILQHISCT